MTELKNAERPVEQPVRYATAYINDIEVIIEYPPSRQYANTVLEGICIQRGIEWVDAEIMVPSIKYLKRQGLVSFDPLIPNATLTGAIQENQ